MDQTPVTAPSDYNVNFEGSNQHNASTNVLLTDTPSTFDIGSDNGKDYHEESVVEAEEPIARRKKSPVETIAGARRGRYRNSAYRTKRAASNDAASAVRSTAGSAATQGLSRRRVSTRTGALSLCSVLLEALELLRRKDRYEIFHYAVDVNAVPEYQEIIKHPMDFGTMERKVVQSIYKNFQQFEDDLSLIFSNCKTFNHPSTIFYKQAVSMSQWWHRTRRTFKDRADLASEGAASAPQLFNVSPAPTPAAVRTSDADGHPSNYNVNAPVSLEDRVKDNTKRHRLPYINCRHRSSRVAWGSLADKHRYQRHLVSAVTPLSRLSRPRPPPAASSYSSIVTALHSFVGEKRAPKLLPHLSSVQSFMQSHSVQLSAAGSVPPNRTTSVTMAPQDISSGVIPVHSPYYQQPPVTAALQFLGTCPAWLQQKQWIGLQSPPPVSHHGSAAGTTPASGPATSYGSFSLLEPIPQPLDPSPPMSADGWVRQQQHQHQQQQPQSWTPCPTVPKGCVQDVSVFALQDKVVSGDGMSPVQYRRMYHNDQRTPQLSQIENGRSVPTSPPTVNTFTFSGGAPRASWGGYT